MAITVLINCKAVAGKGGFGRIFTGIWWPWLILKPDLKVMNELMHRAQALYKYEDLKARLKDGGAAAIAFSGGVDSVFLLAAAAAAGMDRLLAVTLVSGFFTRKERERAGAIARDLGVAHLCLELDILAIPDVVKNDPMRCYYCKQAGFSLIKDAAAKQGIHSLMHGINLDDLEEYRPGIKAAEELGFIAPLVAAQFSKQEIRMCSKDLGLPTWDLPAQSCLATRIPQGEKITSGALDMIQQAEDVLHHLGFAQVRVRHHGRVARIEVPKDDIRRLTSPELRLQVSQALKGAGFSFVALDLDGYASGKMNPKQDERA